jgi:acyl carrier protein
MHLTNVKLKEKIFNKQNYITYIGVPIFNVNDPEVYLSKTDNILMIGEESIDIDSKSVLDVINILSDTFDIQLQDTSDSIEYYYQNVPARCMCDFQSKLTIKYKPTESVLRYNTIEEYTTDYGSQYSLTELVHVVNGLPMNIEITPNMYLENLTTSSNVFAVYTANTLSIGLVADYIANTPNQLFLPFYNLSRFGPGPGPIFE